MEGLDRIYNEKTEEEWIALSYDQRFAELQRIIVNIGIENTNLFQLGIFSSNLLFQWILGSNKSKSLRYMLDRGAVPSISDLNWIWESKIDCMIVLIDNGTNFKKFHHHDLYTVTTLSKFHASRKRARLGAIAVISALSVAAFGKDVSLIIARVVWESRGFYSMVSRRHFARRK